ncbi:hypothetical protein OAH18_00575 [bacterium]|nr:hypothetical protein [bacterium]
MPSTFHFSYLMAQQPKGFISKKQATELYRRSARQLTRDITEAITLSKQDALPHLILKTDDGHLHEAKSLTLDRIKEMKAQGMNPMWFVDEIWMDDRFGKRPDIDTGATPTKKKPTAKVDTSHANPNPIQKGTGFSDDYVNLLIQQNTDLKSDKDKLMDLVEELTEHQKQNNVLTHNLQQLLGREPVVSENQIQIVSPTVGQSRQPVSVEAVPESTPPKTPSKKKSKSPKKKVKKKGFLETATPTFYKLFSR